MAVINDIGNLEDIHPRNKQDVGNPMVKSNVKGIQDGNFVEGGNIEFWSHN